MWFRQQRHVGFVAAIAVAIGAEQSALDQRSVSLFLRELQRDVARDDRRAVSALVHYPLIVFAGGVRIPIADAASLIQSYDVVFSPALRRLIAQAALSAPGHSDPTTSVAIASDVAILGINTVHIGLIGRALRITSITVPMAASASERTAPDHRTAGRSPQRLILGVGQIQRAGALARGERDAYLLSATKNQLLEVRINGVSGRDIVAQITGIKSRTPIDSRARDGARTWIGRIPEDGEYRIEVVRLAAGNAPRLPYVMIVGLR